MAYRKLLNSDQSYRGGIKTSKKIATLLCPVLAMKDARSTGHTTVPAFF